MDLKLMTFIVVGLTFAIYIFIAIRARAGSTIPVDWIYLDGTGNPVDSSHLVG